MNKLLTIIFVLALPFVLSSQCTNNPSLQAGSIAPSPLTAGSGGILSFTYIENLLDYTDDENNPVTVTICLSNIAPANGTASVGGSFASSFNWQYDPLTNCFLGTQNTDILGSSGGTVTVDFVQTTPTVCPTAQMGFNANIQPAACMNGVNNTVDDEETVYTCVEACIPPSAPALGVTNNNCGDDSGTFNIVTECAAGSTMEWSVDNGMTWSSIAPVYGVPNSMTVLARCVSTVNADCVSVNSNEIVTAPQAAGPNAPALGVTQNICPSATGNFNIATSCTGSSLEYSTDGWVTTTATMPTWANGVSVAARCIDSNGCTSASSNTVTAITQICCSEPAAPVISVTQNLCPSTMGSFSVTTSCMGSSAEFSIDNGTSWSTTMPMWSDGVTLVARCVVSDNCTSPLSNSVTAVLQDCCSMPSAPLVTVTDNICGDNSGSFNVGGGCGPGTTLEWSTDMSATWSTTVPAYNATTSMMVLSRCVETADATCFSSNTLLTSNPQSSAPSAPVMEVTQNVCPSETGSFGLTEGCMGSSMEYSTDGWVTTSITMPTWADDVSVSAKCVDANGCKSAASNTVTGMLEVCCTEPAAPVLEVTQNVCPSTTGSFNVTTSCIGSTLEFSVDNGTSWTTTMPTWSDGVTVIARCVVSSDCVGPISNSVTAVLEDCCDVPSAPLVTVTDNVCGDNSGSFNIDGGCSLGSTLEWSIDMGATWSTTVPDYNATASMMVMARCVETADANCFSSNTFLTSAPQSVAPDVPTLAVTQNVCPSTTGSFSVTSGCAGSSIQYSTDGWVTTSTTMPTWADGVSVSARCVDANGCTSAASNTVTAMLQACCEEPAAPVIAVTQNVCPSTSGSFSVTTSCMGSTVEFSVDNGTSWTSTMPMWSDGVTVIARCVITSDCVGPISNSITAVLQDCCDMPLAPSVTVTDNICGDSSGSFNIEGGCGTGTTLEWSIDMGGSWSTAVPVYDATASMMVMARCVETADPNCFSSNTLLTSNPQSSAPSAPVMGVTQNVCPSETGSFSLTEGCMGSSMEYSTDGWVTTSTTMPIWADGVSVSVRCIDTNGCTSAASNTVTAMLQTCCSQPAAPVLAVTQNVCPSTNGNFTVTTACTGSTLEFSVDNAISWTTTMPIWSDGVTVITRCVISSDCVGPVSNSVTAVLQDCCDVPSAPLVTVTDNICGDNSGSFNIDGGCSLGSGLEWSTDMGATWSTTVPVYNATTSMMVMARCVETADANCFSSNTLLTSNPQSSAPSAPVMEVTQNVCPSETGSFSLIEGCMESSMEFSTDGWITTSTTMPIWADGVSVSVRCVDANGCTSASSNTVTAMLQACCAEPAAPVLTVTQNVCPSTAGSYSVTTSCMGSSIEFSADNGTSWTSTMPIWSDGVTVIARCVMSTDCVGPISNSVTAVLQVCCDMPMAPLVTVTDNICGDSSGSFNIDGGCGLGSSLEWSTDMGASWSTTVPAYDATTSMMVIARCVETADANCFSSNTIITSNPQSTAPSAPVLEVTQNVCPSETGNFSLVEGCMGSSMEYSTDGWITSSTTMPTWADGVSVSAKCVDVNGCASSPSNTVTAMLQACCTEPSAPVLAVTQNVCPSIIGSFNMTTGCTGSSIEFSTDGWLTMTANMPTWADGVSVSARCVDANGCTSAVSNTVTAMLQACCTEPLAPVLAVTQNVCPSNVGSFVISSVCAAGSSMEFSTDGGNTWAELMPEWNDGLTLVARCVDGNGCSSPLSAVVTASIEECLDSDVSITKALANGQSAKVSVGEIVSYTITITNNGGLPINEIEVSDLIPNGMTYLTANSPTWLFDGIAVANSTLSISNGLLPLTGLMPDASVSVDIQLQLDKNLPQSTTITNTAEFLSAQNLQGVNILDLVSSNDSSSADVVTAYMDLSLTKTLEANQSGTVDPGGQITFTIEVTNEGTMIANNIVVSDIYPAELMLNDMSWYQGVGNTATYTIPGALAPGETYSFNAVFDVDMYALGMTLTNVAEITSLYDEFGDPVSDIDSTPGNNIDGEDDMDNVTLGVSNLPVFDLALSMNVMTAYPQFIGQVIDFEVIVTNEGNVPVYNIVVEDILGNGFTLSGASPDWTLVPATANVYTAAIPGPLAPGATYTLTMSAIISNTIPDYINQAQLISATTLEGTPVTDLDSAFGDGMNGDDDSDSVMVQPVEPMNTIGDFVWEDMNGDGVQDPGEPGLSNVKVTLYNSNGVAVSIQNTDASGFFMFMDVNPGNYYIKFEAPEGYMTTAQQAGSNSNSDNNIDNSQGIGTTSFVSIGLLETESSIDAGFYKPAIIGDFVWLDSNNNNMQDAYENGINGVRVNLWHLINGDSFLLDYTHTKKKPGSPSDDGYYQFSVAPGEYYLEFVLPSTLTAVFPFSGGSLTDSNVTSRYGLNTTDLFTVSSSEISNANDAGFFLTNGVGFNNETIALSSEDNSSNNESTISLRESLDANSNVLEFETIVKLYPTLTTNSATLSIETAKPVQLQYVIYNSQSQMVMSPEIKNLPIGHTDINVNVKNLTPGLYLVRMIIGKETYVKRLIKVGL